MCNLSLGMCQISIRMQWPAIGYPVAIRYLLVIIWWSFLNFCITAHSWSRQTSKVLILYQKENKTLFYILLLIRDVRSQDMVSVWRPKVDVSCLGLVREGLGHLQIVSVWSPIYGIVSRGFRDLPQFVTNKSNLTLCLWAKLNKTYHFL